MAEACLLTCIQLTVTHVQTLQVSKNRKSIVGKYTELL